MSEGEVVDAQLISSWHGDMASLGDTSLASVTPFSKVQEIERQRRYAHAANLLKEWTAENNEYDEKVWKVLESELDSSGTGFGED